MKTWLKTLCFLTALFTYSAFSAQDNPIAARPVIEEQWSTAPVFVQPESAAYDQSRQQIYVSNVNGYAKDGNGFISSVAVPDQKVELKWIEGLDSPTGLTVADGKLYAVDYDQLLVIDISSKSIAQRFATPHQNPGLNDVVVSAAHGVFVTGSASATIYKLEAQQLSVWKQDIEGLKHANGLFISGNALYFGGTEFKAFDLLTKQELSIELSADTKLQEFDGITEDGCGGLIVTLIDDRRLWRINSAGEAQPLSVEAVDGIDLLYESGRIFVPRVGGILSAYKLNLKDC